VVIEVVPGEDGLANRIGFGEGNEQFTEDIGRRVHVAVGRDSPTVPAF